MNDVQQTVKPVDLSDLFSLDCRAAVYVPSTDNTTEYGAAYDNAHLTRQVMAQLCALFGGATVTRGVGGWVDTHGLITEDVSIVGAFCTRQQLDENIGAVIEIAQAIKILLHQDSVAIEITGRLYLI